MRKKNSLIGRVLSFIVIPLLFINSQAQSQISLTADIVSRYVWRGSDLGNAPAIQPTLAFGSSGIEFGSWGSFALGNNGFPSDELDLFLSFTHETYIGSFSIIATDYYFPTSGGKFFNYNNYDNKNGPGSHILEAGVSFSGSDKFPLSISGYMNFYNDADNTSYFEIAYSTDIEEVGLDFIIGATPGGDAGYYGTNKFNVIMIGISASREIKLSESFSLPIFGSYILNPYSEKAYFVFGLSI